MKVGISQLYYTVFVRSVLFNFVLYFYSRLLGRRWGNRRETQAYYRKAVRLSLLPPRTRLYIVILVRCHKHSFRMHVLWKGRSRAKVPQVPLTYQTITKIPPPPVPNVRIIIIIYFVLQPSPECDGPRGSRSSETNTIVAPRLIGVVLLW